eukprot:m.295583 g.295583  ORF g.295583 m.295583 type:complete len:87 (-) comp16266_c0_seq1:1225-1485(-)
MARATVHVWLEGCIQTTESGSGFGIVENERLAVLASEESSGSSMGTSSISDSFPTSIDARGRLPSPSVLRAAAAPAPPIKESSTPG